MHVDACEVFHLIATVIQDRVPSSAAIVLHASTSTNNIFLNSK